MIPVAEHFAAYHVETSCGTEVVPEDVCGALDPGNGDGVEASASLTPYESCENEEKLRQYLEGKNIGSVERKEGWYGRLSAPGYLDCTSWDGPYDTADEALNAVKEMFDVDDNGDEPSDDDVADGPSSERAP